MPEFAFATCLPGLEPAVKLEVARDRPDLRFAYSRPGLLTFKAAGPISDDDSAGSAFARVWGRSIGAAETPAAASELLRAHGATHGATIDRLHVFARDPAAIDPVALARWRDALAPRPIGDAQPGELVADVIVAPAPDEPAWLGVHRHRAELPAGAGGELGGALAPIPDDAPSRAYAKLEEAVAWARVPIAAGHVALEIGAAPGGAALALARRGVTVWGVDTGALAPVVTAYRHANGAHVEHLAIKVGALRWEQLPAVVDWLLVDVNLAPQVALHEIARLIPKIGPTLRGAIFTLKMNDASAFAELPKLTTRIAGFGLTDLRLRHLPSNRRELCCVALRAR